MNELLHNEPLLPHLIGNETHEKAQERVADYNWKERLNAIPDDLHNHLPDKNVGIRDGAGIVSIK